MTVLSGEVWVGRIGMSWIIIDGSVFVVAVVARKGRLAERINWQGWQNKKSDDVKQ